MTADRRCPTPGCPGDVRYAAPGRSHLEPSKTIGVLTGPERWAAMIQAAVFFRSLLNAPIPRVAVENPVMNGYAQSIIGTRPTQVIQPWMFGHEESKGTGLWLRGLPPLIATEDVRAAMLQKPKREWARIHHAPATKDRWKIRSVTYPGIADAMADQWGRAMEAVA